MKDITIKLKVEGIDTTKINLDGLESKWKSLAATVNNTNESIFSSITKISFALTGVNAAIDLTKRAFDFLSKPISIAANFEQIQTKLTVLYQSADTAQERLQALKEYAEKTPFTLTDLADAEATLASFGITAKQANVVLKQLGDISGGNAEKLKSLALVFGQVSAAGKLQGQDLLQLINIGFNPLTIISQKTGESMSELRKRMEQGGISVEEVAQAFEIATSKGGQFYQMSENQSRTLTGLMSTLQDAFETAAMTLVNAGLIDYVKNTITQILNFIETNKQAINTVLITLGNAVATIINLFGEFVGVIFNSIKFLSEHKIMLAGVALVITGSLIPSISGAIVSIYSYIASINVLLVVKNAWIAVQGALNALLTANPIGVIIVAIGGLITIIGLVIEKTIGLNNAWIYLKGYAKAAWEEIKGFFSGMLEGYKAIYQAIQQLITLDFSGAATTISKIYDRMVTEIKKGHENAKAEIQQMQKELNDSRNKTNVKTQNNKTNTETGTVDGFSAGTTQTHNQKQQSDKVDLESWNNLIDKLDNELDKIEQRRQELREKIEEDGLRGVDLEMHRAKKELDIIKRKIETEIHDETEKQQLLAKAQENYNKKIAEIQQKYNTNEDKENQKRTQRIANYEEKIKNISVNNTNSMYNTMTEIMRKFDEEERKIMNDRELYYSEKMQLREKLILQKEEVEKASMQRLADTYFQTSMQQIDATQSLGKNIEVATRNIIKSFIMEAVAAQFKKVIATIPFPANIIAAPIAATAVAYAIEKAMETAKRIKFQEGGLIHGKSHTLGGAVLEAEGGEFVVNREAYKNNAALIQKINATKQPVSLGSDEIKELIKALKTKELTLNIDGKTAKKIMLLGNNRIAYEGGI